jgi:hypothetical protein
MEVITIDKLPEVEELTNDDLLPVDQAAVTKNVKIGNVKNFINTDKQDKITATGATNLLTAPVSVGGQPGTKAINTLLSAPAAQTANTQLLVAPATQGGVPTLKALSELVQTDNNQTIAGVKTFSSIPVLPSTNPTTDDQATRKAYVDTQDTALSNRISTLENIGSFVGSFDTKALVPTNKSSFVNGITINDFVTVRADETRNGAVTRYVATDINATSGAITWTYDITYTTDISGKVDKITAINTITTPVPKKIAHNSQGQITSTEDLKKSDIGLNNVTNDAQVKRSEMGTANGVASLDGAGIVPLEQLPGIVTGDLTALVETLFPVGSSYTQHLNDPDPIEKGLPGQWSIWTGRAEAYRLASNALPSFTIYKQGANYAANAYVLWHLSGSGYELFKAKAAITNAAGQLNPVLWDKYVQGEIVERRLVHGWLDDDLAVGGFISSGDYAGKVVSEVIALGGTFPSWEGGNRPTFISGGVAGDAIRNATGNMSVRYPAFISIGGIFQGINGDSQTSLGISGSISTMEVSIDFSKKLPTAIENSPRTVSIRFWRRVA